MILCPLYSADTARTESNIFLIVIDIAFLTNIAIWRIEVAILWLVFIPWISAFARLSFLEEQYV